MGVKTYSKSEKTTQTKYTFHRKAGRSIIERVPVFSPDGESLLVIVENIVRVYNIQTGDCARTLETEAPVTELVGIQFPDDENYNLYGCSDDGTVTTWTWDNGAVLREIKFSLPSDAKVLTFNLIHNNKCFITAKGASKYLYLGVYSVKTGELIYEFSDTTVFYFENMTRVSIGWCNGDRFAAITNGTPSLFIQNLNKPHVRCEHKNLNKIRILTVAAHKTESAFVITDALGRATIYRGNLYDRDVGKENLHWHFLPAIAACFSVHGSYLFTGGMERVLVKWTVGNLANKANEKMFIPRLPGFVRFVAANNSHVAVTLSNNSIVIANAQMRVVSTILECGGLSPVARAFVTPLVYHQRLGGLLMGGRTGHLQLYSTTTDKVLYNIDITGMNNTPAERHNLLPIETEVTCAAVSGNSSWLVTSEYRNDGVTYPEERLKFWELKPKDSTPFKLNTCVNLSHGGCNVVALALNSRGEFCVSAGGDQKFRIWKKDTSLHGLYRKKTSWTCLTACYYSSGIAQFLSHGVLNNFKIGQMPPGKGEMMPYLRFFDKDGDVIKKLMNVHKEHGLVDESVVNLGMKRDAEYDMGGVAISQDGSLIAAWFGCKLTLWDTHLCNLRTTLSHPALRPKGVDVKFGNTDAAHYLVCTTENCLAVWSLLSLTIKWMVQINPTCLAADPATNKMAVVTSDNDVIVFTPHSSKPIVTQKRMLSPDSGVIRQCTFGQSSGDDIRLYVMRNDSEIYCLEPEQSNEDRLEVMSRRNLPVSNFGALLAETRLSEVKPRPVGPAQEIDANALGSTAIAQFLSGAPHMMPPVSLLCTSFLLRISGQEESKETEENEEENTEYQESSSEDEQENNDKLNGPYAPKTTQLWTPHYERVKEKRLQRIVKEPLLDLHATESIFGV